MTTTQTTTDDDSIRVIEVDVATVAYDAGHIPGAVLWNIYADLRRPDYLPVTDAEIEGLVARSGIGEDTTAVFYGYGAHLGYWLLASRGHRDVRLLDGPRDRLLESWSGAMPRNGHHPSTARRATFEDVQAAIDDPGTVLLDVRSQAEYDGERFWPSGAPADGRAGRLPGSVHLPIEELRTEDGWFRGEAELRHAVDTRGLAGKRIVTYCTVGNRAAQAWFALTVLLGLDDVAVYDGSWAEWGHLPDTPVER